MLFRQEANKPRSDVTVFGELANLVRKPSGGLVGRHPVSPSQKIVFGEALIFGEKF